METTYLPITKHESSFLEGMLRLYKNIEVASNIRTKINIMKKQEVQLTPGRLISRVCLLSGITVDEIRSEKRNRNINDARMCASRLLRDQFPKLSFSKIGGYLCRDHSTILHHCAMINNCKELNTMYLDLKKRI